MPVVRVSCLPELTQDQLCTLHKAIVAEVVSFEVFGIVDEAQMTTLFPGDMLQYGLGTDIVIEIFGFLSKPEYTSEVRKGLAEKLGRRISGFFTDAKVQCFFFGWGADEDFFWDTDRFRNPSNNWTYRGPFEIHLTAGAKLNNVMNLSGVTFEDKVVRVGFDPNYPGRIGQNAGDIQCHAGGQPFYWGCGFVKKCARPDGSILWQNEDHQ